MQRIFTHGDQIRFAELSGDHNPIHVDPIAARRLLYGRTVVHGVHTLLWAIDSLLANLDRVGGGVRQLAIDALTVGFQAPVFVDEPTDLTVVAVKDGRWRLKVSGRGVRLATINLSLRDDCDTGRPAVTLEAPLTRSAVCRMSTETDLSQGRGALPMYLDPDLCRAMFPAAKRRLSYGDLATLLATTRLVGMELPGLNSLYVGLDLLRADDGGGPALAYSVEEFDDRFSMLRMRVSGPTLSGTVSAAVRPSPRAQPSYAEVGRLVNADNFVGERALVVGGSRGLGEVCVKALVAGGAEVRFTFHRGELEAERVAADVASAGHMVPSFQYDAVTGRLTDALAGWSPTVLLYFSTPHIGLSTPGEFSGVQFRAYCDVYVEGFADTIAPIQLPPRPRG